MQNDFDQVLDVCIDRINGGESLEAVLADYPEQADILRPLLLAMDLTDQAYAFTPSADAKRAARQRFYEALDKQAQPSFWQQLLSRRLAWATLATVLVILIGGYFGFRNSISPVLIPVEIISSPSPEGNFVFLVSDEVNAIAEFSNLYITVDKVGLLQSGDSQKWIEFVPEVKQFDLTLLPGDVTQELWRGNIPEGQYTQARIYVSNVQGTLKADGSIVNIKVPSNKLELNLPAFNVGTDSITSFTYDLTVMNIGKGQGGEKYHLKPQISESGVDQKSNSDQDKSNGKKASSVPDGLPTPPVNNSRKK